MTFNLFILFSSYIEDIFEKHPFLVTGVKAIQVFDAQTKRYTDEIAGMKYTLVCPTLRYCTIEVTTKDAKPVISNEELDELSVSGELPRVMLVNPKYNVYPDKNKDGKAFGVKESLKADTIQIIYD